MCNKMVTIIVRNPYEFKDKLTEAINGGHDSVAFLSMEE